MEKSILFTSPITYIILLVIIALHIGSAFLPTEAKSKKTNTNTKLPLIALYVCMGINLLLHVALFVITIIKNAPASDMLLALMISAAVGSTSIGINKKN